MAGPQFVKMTSYI